MTFNIASDAETLTIPCNNAGVFNAVIDWGDSNTSNITSYNDADLAHEYVTAGEYQVSITGMFPNIYFYNGGGSSDKLKLLSVDNVGDTGLTSLQFAFYECENLISVTAGDSVTPALASMEEAFSNCYGLVTIDLSGLDVSACINFSSMCYVCVELTTIDIADWDVSSGATFRVMFQFCYKLATVDVSSWDTSSGVEFDAMFDGCTVLPTLDVSEWSMGIAEDINAMFKDCPALTDVAIDGWDISTVNDFRLFLNGSSIPTARYDATLIAWDALTVQPGETVDFGSSTYTGGGVVAAAKLSLETNDTWTINDGGVA
jgi:surface protein